MTRFRPYDPSMGITQDQYEQQIAQANEQLYGGGLSSLSGSVLGSPDKMKRLEDYRPRQTPWGKKGINKQQWFEEYTGGPAQLPGEHPLVGIRPRIPSFDDRGGYMDWRRDEFLKPRKDAEPWINKETGEPWKSKGRGDMPPGYKAGPTDAPEPWPDDPRLAEYEQGPTESPTDFPGRPITFPWRPDTYPPDVSEPMIPPADIDEPFVMPPQPPVMPLPKLPVMPLPQPPVMEPPPPVVALPPPDIKPLLPPELLPYKPPEDERPRPTPVNPILPGLYQPPTGQQASNLTYSRGPAIRPPSVRLKHGGSLTNRVSDLLQILS